MAEHPGAEADIHEFTYGVENWWHDSLRRLKEAAAARDWFAVAEMMGTLGTALSPLDQQTQMQGIRSIRESLGLYESVPGTVPEKRVSLGEE